MRSHLTEILGLPGIEVEDEAIYEDRIILSVERKAVLAVCPRCGEHSTHMHQNHGYFVRDLNLMHRQVLLKVNRRQFKCMTCKKPFSEDLNFVGRRRKHTDRFCQMIVQQVIHSSTHNVAQQNDLSDDEVWSIVKYMSQKKLHIDLKPLKRLGIDEIALRKGQKDYITVLVDLDRRVPIAFVCSRKHKDIKDVFKGWGSGVLEQIIEVSIDMSGNYRSLVQKILPNATIVADRFHVMKMVGDELNSAIIKEKKSVNLIEDEAEKEEKKGILSRSKYAILKPEERLTEVQKVKLDEVSKNFPLLAKMHQQKEAFRDIFEKSENWVDGTFSLLDWIGDASETFEKSVGTIQRWMSEIIGYFDYGTTSGAVEGINNRLKLIKRLGYGFRNFENFSLRCLICWHLDIGSA